MISRQGRRNFMDEALDAWINEINFEISHGRTMTGADVARRLGCDVDEMRFGLNWESRAEWAAQGMEAPDNAADLRIAGAFRETVPDDEGDVGFVGLFVYPLKEWMSRSSNNKRRL
jgi:hypothetical protein